MRRSPAREWLKEHQDVLIGAFPFMISALMAGILVCVALGAAALGLVVTVAAAVATVAAVAIAYEQGKLLEESKEALARNRLLDEQDRLRRLLRSMEFAGRRVPWQTWNLTPGQRACVPNRELTEVHCAGYAEEMRYPFADAQHLELQHTADFLGQCRKYGELTGAERARLYTDMIEAEREIQNAIADRSNRLVGKYGESITVPQERIDAGGIEQPPVSGSDVRKATGSGEG